MSARLPVGPLLCVAFMLIAAGGRTNEASANEARALEIARRLEAVHTPFGLVLDTIHTAPGSPELIGYLGYGDAALWTGVYLGADAYRFAVTGSGEALASVKRSLRAIDRLSRVSGDGMLTRYYYPLGDPHVAFFRENRAGTEYHQTRLDGLDYYFVTRTSRDQFAGVFFGLGAAYDLVDEPEVQRLVRDITTRLVDALISRGWHIYNLDGRRHDTFLHRPEQ